MDDERVYIPTTTKIADSKDSRRSHVYTKSLSTEENQVIHDSSLSIYERLRHFLYINFVLNKRSFILSILSYFADVLLFVALNLYLFSNKKFIYEEICDHKGEVEIAGSNISRVFKRDLNETFNNVEKTTIKYSEIIRSAKLNSTSKELLNSSIDINHAQFDESTTAMKQSYLTLQIAAIFVFFICFILSYLIKLQFKYHRLAINLYDYDVETLNSSAADRDDGRDSLASTTTASHFSSKRKLTTLLKRLLVKLLTKFASVMLNFFLGYQFCQNCFIQQSSSYNDAFTIFTHIFILVCVLFRCGMIFMCKKNSMNKLIHLKKLEQKQKDLFNPTNAKNPHRFYYYYYYSYLIKNSQIACNQLKQHQNNQSKFRIFQLNDTALFVGFILALFQLFHFLQALELIFLFMPILLTLIMFRFKSILNATVNLSLIILAILYLSQKSVHVVLPQFRAQTSSNLSCSHGDNEEPSTFNLLSYNLFTFFCFLLTFYLKAIMSIYYCSLTSLERWNLAFLSKLPLTRKLAIFFSFFVYALFFVSCMIALCVEYEHWAFLVIPIFLCLALVWCSFELMNTINLTYLMNKINDCYLLMNEPVGALGTESIASGILNGNNNNKRVQQASNLLASESNSTNIRNSMLSQSSNINNQRSSGSLCSYLRLRKYLQRFLNYLLYNDQTNVPTNIPIHRILAYKGVRHLGSISYRISLYCFIQTLLLAIFTFNTNSTYIVGVYLCTLSLNFIWISLLYQFCKSITGSCVAYALVAPPHLLNSNNNGMMSIDSGGNYTNTSSLLSNPTLFKKPQSNRGNINSLSQNTNFTMGTMTTMGTMGTENSSSLMYLPFNYQQAISQRCTLILRKIQQFLEFHLIENFGCDFAATGLEKEPFQQKIRSFFQKRQNTDEAYDTYLLYYCGPTSSATDNLSFIDGNEMSIEEIVSCWKEINCQKKVFKSANNEMEASKSDEDQTPGTPPQNKPEKLVNSKSRLIIILDSEHTAKSLDYIKSKLVESNIYVALQTASYNYSTGLKHGKGDKKKLGKVDMSKQVIMGPGSPQTLSNASNYESYLNFGKFTLDWLKSNYFNSFNSADNCTNGIDDINYSGTFYSSYNKHEFDEEREHLHLDEDDEDEDDSDEMETDIHEAEKQNINRHKLSTLNPASKTPESSVFYEAKCAFSRYWIDFSFDGYEKAIAQDFDQFWRIYYPYSVCKPLLKLINCRVFYLKFNIFKRILFYLRRIKTRIVPIHEYDTGHGFKLFSS